MKRLATLLLDFICTLAAIAGIVASIWYFVHY